MRRPPTPIALLLGVACLLARTGSAWPGTLVENLARDARRLVPRSLGLLLAEREAEILEQVRRLPAPIVRSLATDLPSGRLRPETLALLEAQPAHAVELFHQSRVSEGILQLGALMRVPADLADPVLSAGPRGYPAGVARQYYAFVERSLHLIPVVLEDRAALHLDRGGLAGHWQGLLDSSRVQSPVILRELFRHGRVVDQRRLDHRNPVFGVASLAYSRAVTGIAATWLAVWREVGGDPTRVPVPREIGPKHPRGGAPAGEPGSGLREVTSR
jgi:hypothetical protein